MAMHDITADELDADPAFTRRLLSHLLNEAHEISEISRQRLRDLWQRYPADIPDPHARALALPSDRTRPQGNDSSVFPPSDREPKGGDSGTPRPVHPSPSPRTRKQPQ